jgi:hypothetical protein
MRDEPRRALWVEFLVRALLIFGAVFAVSAAEAADWLQINPTELQMTSDPKAPRAPAIFLRREIDRDDTEDVVKVSTNVARSCLRRLPNLLSLGTLVARQDLLNVPRE